MKQNQKLVLLIIISFLCIPSFAQRAVEKPDRLKPQIGIRAGLNLSNVLEEEDNSINSKGYDILIGFHASIFVKIPMSKRFAFEPGIMISRKGFQNSETWTDSIGQFHDFYEIQSLYYIDIPLTFTVSQHFGSFGLHGAVGPYVGIGIAGSIYDEDKIDGVKSETDNKISWGVTEGKDDFKHMDWGFTFGMGVEIKSIQISFYYDLGMGNISVDRENGLTINNKVARISLAYIFGKIE